MITPEQAVVAAMLTCLAGAALCLAVARSRRVAGWTAVGVTAAAAALALLAAARVASEGPGQPAAFWAIPELGFALRLHVDGLTAVFLALAALISVPAALYAVKYLDHYPDYSVARYHPYFLVFLAAMYGLVSTTDMMWFFFIFWQMMTLPGYALIRFEHRDPANRRAATKYLVMMQLACGATLIGAELLAVTGAATDGSEGLKYDFDSISANLPLLLLERPGTVGVAFALFLAGFGIKMGMWPFGQVWLPDAHPAAPSPVSAMLSGVMIKTGVYGLLRYFLWLVPPAGHGRFPLAEWGWVVTALGTVTLFTGTMQALKQEQSKRLLAFHSIGQVGYILLGTGTAMVLLGGGRNELAPLGLLALVGALFHTLNHGVFKALLFLNAGSMLHATGTQDLNRLGGLIRAMPITAATALVASLSIAGVPLFNGFSSKWNLYVAAVAGSAQGRWLVLAAVVALLTSVLTLASFIKFYGASFLARPGPLVRDATARGSRLEVPWTMQIPQLLLAGCCLFWGVVPGQAVFWLERGLGSSHANFPAAGLMGGTAGIGGSAIALEGPQDALLAPAFVAVVLALTWGFTVGLAHLGGARRRVDAPWLCGYAVEDDSCRYSAHHFYTEIKRWFRWLGGNLRPGPSAHTPAPARKGTPR